MVYLHITEGHHRCVNEHLKRRHYAAFCEAITNDSSDTPSTSKQTRLDSFTRSVVCSRTRSKAITDRITGVIIKDLRPINFADGEDFQNLMSFVEPGYHLPSATYFMKLIELKYEEAVAKLFKQLITYQSLLTCGPALPMMLTLA